MKIIADPREIERKSFRIVDRHLRKVKLPRLEKEVMQRAIHATSDPSYARDLVFHPDAVRCGLAAIRKGKDILTDASMVKAGINKRILAGFGGKSVCLIGRKDIARSASRLHISRSMVAMRKAHALMDGGIVAIGNAPTALFELCDLVRKGAARPALIVGLPVGFVGAKEAKMELRGLHVPYITNRSRYGGSSVTAACVNALLKIADGEKNKCVD